MERRAFFPSRPPSVLFSLCRIVGWGVMEKRAFPPSRPPSIPLSRSLLGFFGVCSVYVISFRAFVVISFIYA